MGRESTMVALVVLLLLSMVTSVAAQNTTVFRWSADRPTFDRCGGAACSTCDLRDAEIDTASSVEGAASMRVDVDGSVQADRGCTSAVGPNLGSPTNGEWICWSFAMRMDPGFLWGGDAPISMKFGRTKRDTDTLPTYTTAHMRQWQFLLNAENVACEFDPSCRASGYSKLRFDYSFDPRSNPDVTRWQGFTLGIRRQSDPSTFDGRARMWVDGVLVGTEDGFGLCGPTTCGATMVDAWGGMGTRVFPQFCDNDPGTPCDPVPGGQIWLDDFRTRVGPAECEPYVVGAALPPDAGAPVVDGGIARFDGGPDERDAGSGDADPGDAASRDAGPRDVGPEDRVVPASCGCRATRPSGFQHGALLVAAAGLVLSRRRR